MRLASECVCVQLIGCVYAWVDMYCSVVRTAYMLCYKIAVMHACIHTRWRLMANKGDSESTEPVNLTCLPQVCDSLLLNLKKLSGKPSASRDLDKKKDEGTTRMQPPQGHIRDQEAECERVGYHKDGYASNKSNTSNNWDALEESLSNMEYREPMIASL